MLIRGRRSVALAGASGIVLAACLAAPAMATCSGAPNVVCNGNDPDGFVSNVSIGSLTVRSGAVVDDTGTGGNGAVGGITGAVIEILSGTFADIEGDVVIDGTIRDTGAPGMGLFVENDIDGTLTVNGTVTATGFGLFINDDLEGGFVNNGTINANFDALFIDDNLRGSGFLNTGTMISNFGSAFDVLDVTGNVINTGTMRSAGPTVFTRDIFGNFVNTGDIQSTEFNAVDAFIITGGFFNSGTIMGDVDGVNVLNIFGGFYNSGTIIGGDEGVRVYSDAGESSTFMNLSGGTITGDRAFASDDGAERFTNYGTLRGTSGTAIDFGGGNDAFIIGEGSQIFGDSLGGAGIDTLIWTGNDTLDSDFFEFDNFNFSHSSTGTLTGTVETITNNINSGTLLVNGTLGTAGGQTFVNEDATLGGTGSLLGDLTARNGSTIGPGNSIGTLTVGGNATLEAGSTFGAELGGDGTSDLLRVGGTTTLENGDVSVLTPDSQLKYTSGQRFTILNSTGGLTGTFGTVIDNSIFLDFAVTYDANSVYVTTTRVANFTDVAQTYNQKQIAMALENADLSNADADNVSALLSQLSLSEILSAYDAMQGEIHASGMQMAAHGSNLFNDLLMNMGRGNGRVTVVSPAASHADARLATALAPQTGVYGADILADAVAPIAPARDYAFWTGGFGGYASLDGDGNASAWDAHSAGAAFGIEADLGQVFAVPATAGLAVGYSSSWGELESVSQSADIENYHAGLYARFGVEDKMQGGSLRGAISYAWQEYDTVRHIAFPGLNRTATASYGGQTISAEIEARYGIALTSGAVMSPFAYLESDSVSRDGFSETGAASLNLSSGNESYHSTVAGLGVAIGGVFDHHGLTVRPGASIAYERVVGDDTPGSALAMSGSPTIFQVRGPAESRDRLHLTADADIDFSATTSLRLGLESVLSEDREEFSGLASLKFRF